MYETKDHKYLSVGASEEKFWKNICELIGKPEWIELHEGPDEVQEQLKNDMAQLFKQKNQKEWLDLLAIRRYLCRSCYDVDEIFSDPQIIDTRIIYKHESSCSR